MADLVIDCFAGPGGWDEGVKPLGIRPIGIEWDHAACMTAMAAGHVRVEADVAAFPLTPLLGRVAGLIQSPPCQAWSMAGKRKGELDRANCHVLADRMANGDDRTEWIDWEDPRSPLVCQPVRWVRELRPEWVALEEVPAVAPLWEHFALIFRRWGYSVWTGDLNSADYGVPQTRTRRILMASRVRNVQPPEATHAQAPADDLFGGATLPWVTMADALGWGMTARPSVTIMAGSGRQGGADPLDGGSGARTTLKREREEGRWAFVRPATTVMGDPRLAPPGYRGGKAAMQAGHGKSERAFGEGSIRVTTEEAGILQSFRNDFPWQGSRTKQFQQIGNAFPPRLATHVIAALVGIPVAAEVAA